MNRRRRYRAVLILGTVGLLLTVACGLWLRSARRQEALNRQLIAALVKIEEVRIEHVVLYDNREVLALVNAGADPNTPFTPVPRPSLRQMWDHLVRRSALPINDTPTAFELVCGSLCPADRSVVVHYFDRDDPQLVQTMLQHGANKDAMNIDGWTPLMLSIWSHYPKTVGMLLKHGADVNAQDHEGETALYKVADFGDFTESGQASDICRQLLAHGADPTLRAKNGETVVQYAPTQRPDLVALLKQAGAKK